MAIMGRGVVIEHLSLDCALIVDFIDEAEVQNVFLKASYPLSTLIVIIIYIDRLM